MVKETFKNTNMKKLLPVIMIAALCFSACAKETPVSEPASADSEASVDRDSFVFPPAEEMNAYLAPYIQVLDDIKSAYGVEIVFSSRRAKENLYLCCLNFEPEKFKDVIMESVNIDNGQIVNLPYSLGLFEELEAEITRKYEDSGNSMTIFFK